MKILWDECVDHGYRSDFAKLQPQHEYDNAEEVGLGGGDPLMVGLRGDKKDEKLASEAARQYDVVVTSDKRFLGHMSEDRIPVNVCVVNLGRDSNGDAINSDRAGLHTITTQLSEELTAIERGDYPMPQLISIAPKPFEQALSDDANASGDQKWPTWTVPSADELSSRINDPSVSSIVGVPTETLQADVDQAASMGEGLKKAIDRINEPFSESAKDPQNAPQIDTERVAFGKVESTSLGNTLPFFEDSNPGSSEIEH